MYFFFLSLFAQQPTALWDSIKLATAPVVAPSLANEYETPYRQPLSAYGWEDGIHISRDGLHLYALYYPGDLFSWTVFFLNNISSLTPCQLLGNTDYFRDYADTYGMDLTTNALACDTFINVDILYASRQNLSDNFTHWQLSNMARPGTSEGGPFALFSQNNSNSIDIFLFTVTSDIWMIRNTVSNPENIINAIRLPQPVNPATNEFNADNPHLERLNGDTLLLVYEKYTNPQSRNFVYSFSYDNGYTWTTPITMTTISPVMGHIEHPHLYKNQQEQWFIYFSMNCEIYRAKQAIPNNWDSWENVELVIAKGNAPCIGEPSLTNAGDISFAVAYYNPHIDATDAYDIDPWFLPAKNNHSQFEDFEHDQIIIFPNPATNEINIKHVNNEVLNITVFNMHGKQILLKNNPTENELKIDVSALQSGIYFVQTETKHYVFSRKVVILK